MVVDPPAEANLAMRLGLDLGVKGLENRSGLGYATFEPESAIEPDVVAPAPYLPELMNLNPPGIAATTQPDTLKDHLLVVFSSDNQVEIERVSVRLI